MILKNRKCQKQNKQKDETKIILTQSAQIIFPQVTQLNIKSQSIYNLKNYQTQISNSFHQVYINSQLNSLNNSKNVNRLSLSKFSLLGNGSYRNKLIDLNKLPEQPRKLCQKKNKNNIQIINNVLTKDIVYKQNKFLKNKAYQFAKKTYNSIDISKQKQNIFLHSKINKHKSYIARIDRLYKNHQIKYNQMMETIRTKNSCKWRATQN